MSNVISAAQVRELRERTGAPMMDCKKALEATNGDMDRAIEELRKQGITKAGKKASRVAAEGSIAIAVAADGKAAVMSEVNCETDFVARDPNFTGFVKSVTDVALNSNIVDVNELAQANVDGKTIEEVRQELVAKIGENVQVRRVCRLSSETGTVGTYLHGSRIGVLVALDTDNNELARDIAMHIAASKPIVILPDDVPQDIVAKEKEIYTAQAAGSGKPAEIVEKMVLGRLRKYLEEVSLVGQPFVKEPDVSVGSLLNKNRAKVLAFQRYEVGEGIEKVTEDFKEAVMQQVKNG